MIHDVEHLFMCWFAINISSLVEYLYILCPLFLTVEFCVLILESTYEWYHMILVSVCLTYCSWWRSLGPPMLLEWHSSFFFKSLSSLPLCICAISSVFIHLPGNVCAVSRSWLLWTVLLWTQGCMYLFELEFCLDICPGVRLLDHIVILILVFCQTSTLFPIVVASTYIPITRGDGFLFFHTLSSICYLYTFWWWSF